MDECPAVNEGLAGELELEPRELVAIVGAGGKSTILHQLGSELAESGSRVLLTTTTKMGRDQATEPVVRSTDPEVIAASLLPGKPLFLVIEEHPHKISGPTPEQLDQVFADSVVDIIIAEADGARSRLIKAPAGHEPVIPASATTVIAVVSVRAIGERIADVAHRPELVADLLGVGLDAELTTEAVAALVTSPSGGRKAVPRDARFIVAITAIDADHQNVADDLSALLIRNPGVDAVVKR